MTVQNKTDNSGAAIANWLRSHDAKVRADSTFTGQAEQRLHRINELLELLRNCGMQGRAQRYVQEIRELVAALQDSQFGLHQ